MIEIEKATDRDLLALFASVMDELRGRGVVRSSNSPGADYESPRIFRRAPGLSQAAKARLGCC